MTNNNVLEFSGREEFSYPLAALLRSSAQQLIFQVLESGSVWYPVSLETLILRIAQTFGLRAAKLPDFLARRIISLPIGLMFIALRKLP